MKIDEVFEEVKYEDDQHEFKSILNRDDPIKWAKTLVAFANGEGGSMYVGVNDDREVFGLSIKDIDEAKNLVDLVNDRHIFPHIKIRFRVVSVDDNAERFVLVIMVSSCDSIVRYKAGDHNETVYIKGDGNAKAASPEDIIALSKRRLGVDNYVTNNYYDEIDFQNYLELCSEFREDHSRPSIKELKSRELVTTDGYIKSGLLMFRDDYDGDDSLVVCRLWRGLDKAGTVLDRKEYKGPLSYVLSSSLTFIEKNTKVGWQKLPYGGRKEIRSYPKEAIREAVVNAIAHRDYSISGTQIDIDIFDDRIDIVSPGSWLLPRPYNEYPIGSIPSIRRNSVISIALDVANLMERGGTGFLTMIKSYECYAKEKQPVVMLYPGFLDLRLFDLLYDGAYEIEPDRYDKEREAVIMALKTGPKTTSKLQEYSRYKSRSTLISKVIDPLIQEGIIERVGNRKSPSSYIRLKKKNQN